MRKIKSIVFISILAAFSACNSSTFEEHEIGGNLIDGSTQVIMVDTFTVEASTVKLDSVTTSGFSNVLLGKYSDPYFGNVKSDFYGVVDLATQFKLRTVSGEKVFVEFDSLVFIMYHEANKMRFVGDTLADYSMSVHRITQEFELPENKFSYKAHDVLSYEMEELGSTTFTPRLTINSVIEEIKDTDPESKKGGVRIRLDNALGQDIINKVNSSDENLNLILEDKVKWLDYFKGIVLKASDENSAIFSFQTGVGMKMRLYYHDTNSTESGVLRFHDFPIVVNSANRPGFTNYLSDFTSDEYPYMSQINDLLDIEDDVSSEDTDDLCFVQATSGLMTKIKIPHIEHLNRMGLTGGILKAELVFSPEEDSWDKDILRLPFSNFELYSTNDKNRLLNPIVDPATGGSVTSRFIPKRETDESYYSFNITEYVNNILLNGQEYDDALMVSLPVATLGNSVDRLVIEHDPKSDDRMRLRVTYVVQNN